MLTTPGLTGLIEPLLHGGVTSVAALARAAVTVDAAQTCGQVDALLRGRPELLAIAVRRRDDPGGEPGLVGRDRFSRQVSGPFGYGRALHEHRRRPPAQRYDEVLVAGDDGALGVMAVADLFEALAASYADQALHGGLTGLANLEVFFRRLHGACARAGDSGRVAVLFVDLDRFYAGQ